MKSNINIIDECRMGVIVTSYYSGGEPTLVPFTARIYVQLESIDKRNGKAAYRQLWSRKINGIQTLCRTTDNPQLLMGVKLGFPFIVKSARIADIPSNIVSTYPYGTELKEQTHDPQSN